MNTMQTDSFAWDTGAIRSPVGRLFTTWMMIGLLGFSCQCWQMLCGNREVKQKHQWLFVSFTSPHFGFTTCATSLNSCVTSRSSEGEWQRYIIECDRRNKHPSSLSELLSSASFVALLRFKGWTEISPRKRCSCSSDNCPDERVSRILKKQCYWQSLRSRMVEDAETSDGTSRRASRAVKLIKSPTII